MRAKQQVRHRPNDIIVRTTHNSAVRSSVLLNFGIGSMLLNGHALSDGLDHGQINPTGLDAGSCDKDGSIIAIALPTVGPTRIHKNGPPRIHDHRVAIGCTLGIVRSVLRRRNHVALILNRPRCTERAHDLQTVRTQRATRIQTLWEHYLCLCTSQQCVPVGPTSGNRKGRRYQQDMRSHGLYKLRVHFRKS
jgi:hypothetical protein